MNVLSFFLGLGLLAFQFLFSGGGPMVALFLHPAPYVALISVPVFLSGQFGFKETVKQFFSSKRRTASFRNEAFKTIGHVFLLYSVLGFVILMGSIASGPEVFGENIARILGGLGVGAAASLWIGIKSKEAEPEVHESKSAIVPLVIALLGVVATSGMILGMIRG